MLALVLTAQILAATVATPTPAPVTRATTGQTRTLSDVARERKLGKRPTGGGTLSVSGASGVAAIASGGVDKVAADADARLARAIRDGSWVDQNIHHNEDIRQQARSEWDAAAENCRSTPGCTPVYRENVAPGALMTGNEAARALKKKLGPGVDTPGR